MPANTPSRGYTYATSGDANDLGLITQRLAEQLDTDVTSIVANQQQRFQRDTTNSAGLGRVQSGISRLTAPGGTIRATPKAITFPVAFSATPVVIPVAIGYRASGAFNPVGLDTATADQWLATASDVTATGCVLHLLDTTGTAISPGYDLYVDWIAVGPQ